MIACSKNENFENATKYKPERWLTETGEFNLNQCVGSSITLPFGCGKRICPGKKYTELELMILVIKLVRSFKIKYHSQFERQFEFVLAPKGPVNIQFSDRL
jgi:ecdysone 20-monooxygenase